RPCRRDCLRIARGRHDSGRHRPTGGDVELPYPGRVARAPRSGCFLARASFAPGQYQQDQGDRPLVQPELSPEEERRQVDGNASQPHADAAAAGLPETVTLVPGEVEAFRAEPAPSYEIAIEPPPDLRMTSPGIRLAQIQEELIAWVKTLL